MADELKNKLDTAYENFCNEATETRLKFKENSELHEALQLLYEDVSKYIIDLHSALISYVEK